MVPDPHLPHFRSIVGAAKAAALEHGEPGRHGDEGIDANDGSPHIDHDVGKQVHDDVPVRHHSGQRRAAALAQSKPLVGDLRGLKRVMAARVQVPQALAVRRLR